MGEQTMKLEKEQLEQIGEYIRSQLPRWMEQPDVQSKISTAASDTTVADRLYVQNERIIRVEEEIKNLGKLMQQGFDMMEKRFVQIDKRFEQVDKRFEDLQHQMDKRFDAMQVQMDRRFSTLQWFMGIGITLLIGLITLFQYI